MRALLVTGVVVSLSCSGASSGGTAGSTGTAGMAGAAGATAEAGTTGAAGTAGGAAGTTTTGEGGVTGTGGSAGAGGQTSTAGQGGGGGASAGAAGADAGVDAAAGAAGGPSRPRGPSAGCNLPPAANDSSTAFIKHDVTVTGVPSTFVAAHPPDPAGGAYTWTKRNYYLRLPTNYDPSKPYLLSLGGTGCSGNDTVGSTGGYYLGQVVTAARPETLEVSLSYVVYTNTPKPNCFADDYVDSPEPAYIDAVVADLEARYCVDRSRVFIHGHSSGAWEALTMGCARADTFRGAATQVGGGLRMHRPPCQKSPVATIYVEGMMDTDNPIGPLAPTDPVAKSLDSLGSAPARDDLLTRNGCVGNQTATWDAAFPACVKYTGCPADGAVVWCAIPTSHSIGSFPTLRDQYAYNAIWKFWTTLP
jgi:poly(3-hydroxybutyrate) depolymerase